MNVLQDRDIFIKVGEASGIESRSSIADAKLSRVTEGILVKVKIGCGIEFAGVVNQRVHSVNDVRTCRTVKQRLLRTAADGQEVSGIIAGDHGSSPPADNPSHSAPSREERFSRTDGQFVGGRSRQETGIGIEERRASEDSALRLGVVLVQRSRTKSCLLYTSRCV